MSERASVSGLSRRPVASGDEPFLLALYGSTRADELAAVDWSDSEKQAFIEMQFRAQQQHYVFHFPRVERTVLLVDGEPVGRLYVDRRPDEIRIVDIALLSRARGQGLGSALLEELIAEAKTAKLPLRIHVERFNPALTLYRRLGFELRSEHGVYFLMEKPC